MPKGNNPGELSKSGEDVGITNVPVAISWERRTITGLS